MEVRPNKVCLSIHSLFTCLDIDGCLFLAMAKFMTGPPGGRTLPQTSTRLSDLVGGIYGPGASVASTGISALRPAIKAGVARAAGETWEDVLEYYLVRRRPNLFSQCVSNVLAAPSSSTQIVEKLTLHIGLGRYSTRGASTLQLEELLLGRKVLELSLATSN